MTDTQAAIAKIEEARGLTVRELCAKVTALASRLRTVQPNRLDELFGAFGTAAKLVELYKAGLVSVKPDGKRRIEDLYLSLKSAVNKAGR